ncbi:ERAP1-like C-terminal domain-containing protein [Elsinoe fawcettii]|nr:ERAP1-like C-terminal domain-containing protein [Elsinoe fawcettii]
MASDRDVLPSTVKPLNYNLSLYDLELGGEWSYQGTVKIDVEVRSETKEITLNTHRLNIHSAEVQTEAGKTEGSIKTNNVTYDEKNQRATLHFDQAIPQSHKALITISYSGTMNNDMAGFYRSKYKPAAPAAASVPKDDEYHYMFSTQFESSDARRAFPCFDEPNLKASLEFEIEIPEDQTALSNMQEKEVKKSKKVGLKTVVFEKSPVMSTYLFSWAFGDFEYIEDFTQRKYNGKNLPVRVYSTKGLISQGKLALESAAKIVDYFSEVFKIDYPLPKVDLLAVHEFSHGAMENWGLITYRTTAVLFDEYASDQKYKNRVVYVVAHELAHQWFGNLVTMDWWNELWLNEGFATWVGWYAVDWLHPDWNVWGQFTHEGMQTAFSLDALRTSHPIEVPVRNALEVDQIFDSISYLKGSSCIRMLANHLKPEVFLDGVADYLKTHKFGNATTQDLWNALSKRSGQDVNVFMDPWIRKIGFPVVTVAEEPGQISVKQSRFLSGGGVKPEEDITTWWVPLGLKTGGASSQIQTSALTVKQDTIRNIDDSFYKLNTNQTGFYRTNLPPQRLQTLSKQLDKLSVEDKIGLIGDASALAISGDATTAGVLSFLEGLDKETDYLVWSEILAALGNIRSIFADDEAVSNGLRAFTLKLVSSATDKIGWTFEPKEDYLTGQLRALLISSAGLAGHEATVAEANKRFDAYFSGDKNAIHPSLRLAVFKIAIKTSGKEAYLKVRKEFESTTSVDGKEITLAAMGRVPTADLARDYLDWSFSGAVATQDLHTPARALALNSAVRNEVWAFIKKNWQTIFDKLSGNMVVLERFLRMSLTKYASKEVEQDIQNFFKDKDQKGFDRGLAVVSDTIKGLAGYRERDGKVIKEWLQAHGYGQ